MATKFGWTKTASNENKQNEDSKEEENDDGIVVSVHPQSELQLSIGIQQPTNSSQSPPTTEHDNNNSEKIITVIITTINCLSAVVKSLLLFSLPKTINQFNIFINKHIIYFTYI